jgi:hypothetical protein
VSTLSVTRKVACRSGSRSVPPRSPPSSPMLAVRSEELRRPGYAHLGSRRGQVKPSPGASRVDAASSGPGRRRRKDHQETTDGEIISQRAKPTGCRSRPTGGI